MFEIENKFYQENRENLRKNYLNKEVVITKNTIFGAYDTVGQAFGEAIKTLPPKTFTIKHIYENSEDEIQRFKSRVYG
jgi:hypothetical protein